MHSDACVYEDYDINGPRFKANNFERDLCLYIWKARSSGNGRLQMDLPLLDWVPERLLSTCIARTVVSDTCLRMSLRRTSNPENLERFSAVVTLGRTTFLNKRLAGLAQIDIDLGLSVCHRLFLGCRVAPSTHDMGQKYMQRIGPKCRSLLVWRRSQLHDAVCRFHCREPGSAFRLNVAVCLSPRPIPSILP